LPNIMPSTCAVGPADFLHPDNPPPPSSAASVLFEQHVQLANFQQREQA
jgi:hypothetical protein